MSSKNFNAPIDLGHLGQKGLRAHYTELMDHLAARPSNMDPSLTAWAQRAEILRLHVAIAAAREVA